MKRTRAGLMILGIVVLGFGSSAKADAIGLGPSLALDALPVAVQFEHDLTPQWSLNLSLSFLSLVSGGTTYYWTSTESGPYTSARAGVGLAFPIFSAYVHQGYRFALGERSALDLEVGAGWVRFNTGSPLFNSTNDFENAFLPSLALRFNIKF